MTTRTNAFDQDSFWIEFEKDLISAQARVIVQSPFVSERRLRRLRPIFSELSQRKVVICAFLQEPYSWRETYTPLAADVERNEDLRQALARLEEVGVHSNLRPQIHEKIAVIDNKILWEGSLNILSHTKTFERMRRFSVPEEVQEVIRKHRLLNCNACQRRIAGQHLGDPVNQFKGLRKQTGLTQKALAERLKIRQTNVARLESGSRSITVATLAKYTNELGLKIVIIPEWYLPTLSMLLEGLDD